MPGPADTYLGYGPGWANASNTPFREYKHWVHEGGISSPLIAHWPAGIPKEANGTWRREPFVTEWHFQHWMFTFRNRLQDRCILA